MSGQIGRTDVRAYSGLSYAIWVRPTAIRPFSTLHGVEFIFPGIPAVYVAYDLTLFGIPAYAGSNTLEAGVRIGQRDGRGVRIYLSYFSGLETFGALYNERVSYVAAGFGFDVW
jgi:hypothetical protein